MQHAEDREVGANADRQRDYRDRREPRMLPDRAHRARQVARDLVERARTARLAALLLGRLHAAELKAGPPSRLVARQPRSLEHIGPVLEVTFEFIAQVALPSRAAEQHRRERSQAGPHLTPPPRAR